MAYDTTKLANLAALKTLAEQIKAKEDALIERVSDLENTGGEPNVITAIKVNGTAQTITNKAVNITVPTKVSALTNDSGYQTSSQVESAINTAIAATGHASFEVASSVPTASAAKANVFYLVKNSTTGYYDIYALVSGEVVRLDDTTVDLSNYVQKETGKGLSTNDYTTAEKNKLAGLSNYTHPTYTAKSSGLYKVTVDGTGHVSAATAVAKADITGLGIPAQDTTYSPMTGATSSAAGAAGLVPAPAAGANTRYLRGDGEWAVPTNTDTKVNVNLNTTTKAYLLGTTTTPTSTYAAVTAIADTGVYLDTTAGKLTATSFAGSGASLTSLNASNLSSGTVAAARLPVVTTSANGAMTASDKAKLDGMSIATDTEVTEMLSEVFA